MLIVGGFTAQKRFNNNVEKIELGVQTKDNTSCQAEQQQKRSALKLWSRPTNKLFQKNKTLKSKFYKSKTCYKDKS